MKENIKIHFHRLLWFAISLLAIIIPCIIDAAQPELKIIKDSASIVEYYEYLDETACEVEVEFNREVYSGYIEVAFYDASGNLLDCSEHYFYSATSNNKIVSNTYITVDGEADSYEVISHSIEPVADYYAIMSLLIIAFPMFISSLFLNYQKREIGGKTISVYAGFFHHTLRVNGELCDTHNTLVSFTAIYLDTIIEPETEDQEPILIEASITMTNRIAIKANKKLLKDQHLVDANEKEFVPTKKSYKSPKVDSNTEIQSNESESTEHNESNTEETTK